MGGSSPAGRLNEPDQMKALIELAPRHPARMWRREMDHIQPRLNPNLPGSRRRAGTGRLARPMKSLPSGHLYENRPELPALRNDKLNQIAKLVLILNPNSLVPVNGVGK